MTLRCKPGDLAIVVRSEAGHEGKIVRVLRFIGVHHAYWAEDLWETDTLARSALGRLDAYFSDSQLLPIRDPGEDAQDETLTWLPSPSRERSVA